MTTPTTEDVRRALQTLTEGVPGRNEPHRTGTGEFDNGEVRQALAGAAFTAVLRSEPGDAFDELAHYFEASQLVGWFGTRRAELILEMLLYQTGWTTYSTWNSLRERELRQLGTRPDRRWLDVCSRVKTESARLERLATALRERVAPGPP